MGEKVFAEPAWIGGLGNFVLGLELNAQGATNLVSGHAGSTGEFNGLMGVLRGPIDQLHGGTKVRQKTIGPALFDSGIHLKQAAWDYTSTDHEAGVGIRHTVLGMPWALSVAGPVPSQPRATVADVPGVESIGTVSSVDVSPPPAQEVDWQAVIEDTAGWLGDADEAIKTLTGGWSPLEHALQPVSGNWMELRRIGLVYGKSGTAFDSVAGDLAVGDRQIDARWNGRAAVSYTHYSTAMRRGLEWEGAAGGLLSRGLQLAADKLQEAAKSVLRLLKDGLSRFIKVDSWQGILKLAAKAVPGLGQATAVAEVALLLNEIRETVVPLVTEIEQGVQALQKFIEFSKDPVAWAKGKAQAEVDKQLQPLGEFLKKVDLADDLVVAGQAGRVADRPMTPYVPGTGPQVWEDAS